MPPTRKSEAWAANRARAQEEKAFFSQVDGSVLKLMLLSLPALHLRYQLSHYRGESVKQVLQSGDLGADWLPQLREALQRHRAQEARLHEEVRKLEQELLVAARLRLEGVTKYIQLIEPLRLDRSFIGGNEMPPFLKPLRVTYDQGRLVGSFRGGPPMPLAWAPPALVTRVGVGGVTVVSDPILGEKRVLYPGRWYYEGNTESAIRYCRLGRDPDRYILVPFLCAPLKGLLMLVVTVTDRRSKLPYLPKEIFGLIGRFLGQ